MASINDSLNKTYQENELNLDYFVNATEHVMDINHSAGYLGNTSMETSSVSYYEYDENSTFYESSEIALLKQPAHLIAVYSIAYGLVFICGLIGNIFVIAVIIKEPSMRNVTNYFILNLAVADILVALMVVPITLLTNLFTGWRYGAFLCKITPYVQSVAFSAHQ
ncbi:neuropeptide SIFamide receptor-like [Ruditapes philippinarum]|uniref:neuropeptide SIFamide receptor-like n=1 Tax=Ruditapes philippinarum TaxID=129788 RepID=UPI00295B11F3|nr:neuropeptide SIFamide receptor-like [Ruditapes philippinarum]